MSLLKPVYPSDLSHYIPYPFGRKKKSYILITLRKLAKSQYIIVNFIGKYELLRILYEDIVFIFAVN